MFKRFQQEEQERRGDHSAGGARYGYIHFEGPGLLVSWGARNMLAKLHNVMVHPENDRLARMLLLSGAGPEIVEAAKHLRCQVTLRFALPTQIRRCRPRRHRGSTSSWAQTLFMSRTWWTRSGR